MTSTLSMGMSAGLGATLLVAASFKFANRFAFESTVVALLPKAAWRYGGNSRQLSYLVGTLELLLGGLLLIPLTSSMNEIQVASAVLFSGFFAGTIRMHSKRTPCGCFGAVGSPRAVGAAEIARSAFLLSCSLAALLLPNGEAGSASILAVCVAASVFGAGMWPVLHSLVSAVYQPHVHGDVRPEDDSVAVEAIQATTRRGFFGQAGRLAAATLSLMMFGGGVALAGGGGMSCQARFDLCYGCTTKQLWSSDVSCCIGCYGSCQMLVPCPTGSCGGCWP
jgi:hypothetical protein